MAAMFIIISIQHEKKHCKGSKNSSSYFDDKIDCEHETDKLIADDRFDECSFFKDDDMCASTTTTTELGLFFYSSFASSVEHLWKFCFLAF